MIINFMKRVTGGLYPSIKVLMETCSAQEVMVVEAELNSTAADMVQEELSNVEVEDTSVYVEATQDTKTWLRSQRLKKRRYWMPF